MTHVLYVCAYVFGEGSYNYVVIRAINKKSVLISRLARKLYSFNKGMKEFIVSLLCTIFSNVPIWIVCFCILLTVMYISISNCLSRKTQQIPGLSQLTIEMTKKKKKKMNKFNHILKWCLECWNKIMKETRMYIYNYLKLLLKTS